MASTTQNQNGSQSQKRSQAQRRTQAKRTPAQRSAAGKRAAATRQRNQARGSQAQTKGQARTTVRQTRSTAHSARLTARGASRTTQRRVRAETTRVEAALTEAQRPVLISIGAWLTARDNVVSAVRPYTSRKTAERELRRLRNRFGVNVRKFERRGTTERNKLERQVKRTLRRSGRDFERGVDKFESGARDVAKGVEELAGAAL